MKIILFAVALLVISGCGGGGSDSGGGENQAVSDNINAQLQEFCMDLSPAELAQNTECQEVLAQ